VSKRHSEYQRRPADAYYTPAWVTRALLSVETFGSGIWEPACGEGHMLAALIEVDAGAFGSDICTDCDFLAETTHGGCTSIITNPPFSLAQRFVEHSLALMAECDGKVAMLLPSEFDTAKGRRHIFQDHPAYKANHVLTDRIRWANLEQKVAGPSSNHAWFNWDWKHQGPATINYIYGAAQVAA
jgi:hypothetical protein